MSARKTLAALAISLFAVLGLSTQAFAHNVFVSSDPGNGATIAQGPKEVSVTFAEPVQEGPNEITVTGPDGKSRWQQSTAAKVTGDSVRTGLRELGPAGKYTIGYRIISADGHPVSGAASFTLAKAGNGTPAPAEESSTGSGGGVPVWVWIAGAVVVLAIGLWLALSLAKPRKQ